MRIAIVDDERPARSELKYLISQFAPAAEIVEVASSEAFMELLNKDAFDFCFVDISLGGMNGTTLASLIKKNQPEVQIVFATAYQDYAVKAFEIGAVDYLLKPFDYERVKKTMERLMERAQVRSASPDWDINKIMVNAGASFQVLDVGRIVYIETEKRACRIHMDDGGSYLQNESLNNYEISLRSRRFFRIHKSFLINLDYVLEMQSGYNNGYSVKLKHYEKEVFPIGRSQIREFRQIFEK